MDTARRPRPSRSGDLIRLLAITAAMFTVLMLATSAQGAKRPVPPFWWALGVCETGHIGEAGDGAPRFDWGARHRHLEGSRYEGFVGFYWQTWRAWAGAVGVLHRYSHAYYAPPMVQVRVARYGLARGGYWGCLHSHPEIGNLPGR